MMLENPARSFCQNVSCKVHFKHLQYNQDQMIPQSIAIKPKNIIFVE